MLVYFEAGMVQEKQSTESEVDENDAPKQLVERKWGHWRH